MEDLTARFEDGARDGWQRPREVVATLAPFRRVIDLGAGTGYFARRLTGAAERLYAVEPEPAFRAALGRAGFAAYPSVTDVPECVDLILAVDVLRFVEDWSPIREALLPGGRLALIDWRPEETPEGPPVSLRRRPPAISGFRTAAVHAILPHQWFLELERLD